MIVNVFEVLAKELDQYFLNSPRREFHKHQNGSPPVIESDPQSPEPTQFVDNDPNVQIIQFLQQEDQQEYVKFPLNRVCPIMINLEEEKLPPADRFSRMTPNGNRESIQPDIHISLYILFVSHFFDYTDALHYLSLIIRYFQSHPVLNHQNTPGLDEEIDQLMFELETLPLSLQNEVWNSLRSAYHPSLLYKVKMLVYRGKAKPVQEREVEVVENMGK